MKQKIICNSYNNITKYLYDKYYLNFENYSDVTSPHWSSVGDQGNHSISFHNDNYVINGHGGFGSYRTNTLINHIKAIPEKVLLRYLLSKHNCPQNLIAAGKKIAVKSGHIFSFDCVKQLLSLAAILKNLNQGDNFTTVKSICIIGDGYAFLSSLIKTINPNVKVISINLGRTLVFDVLYSKLCIPEEHPILLEHYKSKDLLNSKLIFIEAENYSLLQTVEADLYINIASMQEMRPEIINKYFEYMRTNPNSYFYCCNRLHKELPNNVVTEFMQYPWGSTDDIFFDELCPWYQRYPSSRPPFWRPFDPFQHRLCRLSKL